MAGADSQRALLLAPRGRDAAIAASMLGEGAIEATVCADVAALVVELRDGAGFAIVTEEALRTPDLRGLADFLGAQEEWSDFPFILLTTRGGGLERNPAAGRFLETLGSVTFLERPFHPTTLMSLAQSALRARRRQYEARTRLADIRERGEELRIALAAGQLGAWTYEVQSRRLDASPTCKRDYGRGAYDAFTLDDLLASVHDEDREGVLAAVEVTLKTGADYDVEYRCHWPDGSLHWVQVRARATYDAKGNPLRMTGVSHDVTERKLAEAALREQASELERRVEERTREHEAAMAQLHEAQKLETIGQLTGGIAHDFNNLLTPVVGSLDMLKRTHRDERSQRLLGGALQAAERARVLVSRLLSFARRQNLETRPVDVAALVGGMMDLIQRSIGPQVEVELDTPEGLPAAMVDPNQLELALLNLAVNARDAMPDGGRLRITVAERAPETGMTIGDGRYIRLSVSDTGSGMDEGTLRRAVEPFYSTKAVGKGTGLGLSMVHGLAAQSGGALRLSSIAGEGTTAALWLPVALGPAESLAPKFEQAAARLPAMDVLLVDDEELVRAGTAEMLADLGHRVTQAASGHAALGSLRAGRFDLLVSDYLMPAMNGLELIDQAKGLDGGLKVLLITGFADIPESRATGLARLAKPFGENALARAIAGVVETETARREAGRP